MGFIKDSLKKIFIFIRDGELDNALFYSQRAIEDGLEHPSLFYARGIIFNEKELFDEAILNLLKAINLDPLYDEALNQIGVAYLNKNEVQTSLIFFDKAIKINPNHTDAISNKAIALYKLRFFNESLDFFNQAIKLEPNFYQAHINRGNVFKELGLYEESLADYDCALKLNPNSALAHFNKGNFYKDIKDFGAAIKSYDDALAINPNYIDATWNKSNVLLKIGNYDQGFKLYESRWKTKFLRDSFRSYGKPIWTGRESLKNKKIFVYPEQGFGDMIQFSRYVTMLSDIGAEVFLETPSCLKKLFRTLRGNIKFTDSSNLPLFDFYIPMMSLPFAFNTRLENLISTDNYLSADKEQIEQWNEVLKSLRGIKVGLVWSGGQKPFMEETSSVTQNKSIPLKLFENLAHENISFISLQKGELAEYELIKLCKEKWSGPTINNFSDQIQDFSDTAALISNLDLVISVCTSVAHLSAAIGKKTWIMIPYHPCWRWLDNGSISSPWYHSVKLFRQKKFGDWNQVLEEINTELKKL